MDEWKILPDFCQLISRTNQTNYAGAITLPVEQQESGEAVWDGFSWRIIPGLVSG